jgi:hypothetical protein
MNTKHILPILALLIALAFAGCGTKEAAPLAVPEGGQAGTKTINLRFVGPYPYSGDITINLRVNGGEWHNTKLRCP